MADRGGAGHGEAAEPDRLGDRAVTHVAIGVLPPVAGPDSARISPAGAVNQRSPVPLIRTPTSVPLRAMVVTMVESSTPDAASAVAFPLAMLRFR